MDMIFQQVKDTQMLQKFMQIVKMIGFWIIKDQNKMHKKPTKHPKLKKRRVKLLQMKRKRNKLFMINNSKKNSKKTYKKINFYENRR
jgi:hypothetical protein